MSKVVNRTRADNTKCSY